MRLDVPAYPVTAVSPAIGSTSSASANATAIQAALTAGGEVHLAGSGIAYLGATLVIGAATRLVVDPRLTLKAVSGLNGPLMVSAGYNRAFSSASLSWTAGLTATLTWTAHGRTINDWVWVRGTAGTTDRAYFGIFQVKSVTDADTLVIRLRRKPSAAVSGTIQAKAADSDITVIGGVWNYNASGGNNGAADGPGRFALILAGIHGLVLQDARGTDGQKFLFALGGVTKFDVRRIVGWNTASDIVKVYGPAFDGQINDISGDAGDDVVTVQCQEVSPFTQYDYTGGGDLMGLTVADVHGKSLTRTACIYPDPNFYCDGIEFRSIGGEPAVYSVGIVGPSTANGKLGKVRLKDIEWASGVNYPIINVAYANIDHLDIDGLLGDAATASTYLSDAIAIGSGSILKKVSVRGIRANPAAGGSAYYAMAIAGAAVVDHISISDCAIAPSAGAGMRLLHLSSTGGAPTIKTVTLRDNDLKNIDTTVLIDSGVTAPLVVATGNRFDTVGSVLNTASAATLVLGGNVLTNVYNGPLRTTGVAVTLTSWGGNTNSLGTWVARVNGTEVVTVYGQDIQVDVTTVARVNGSTCYNTNAAAGTLASAGVVDCLGTAANSWKLRGNNSLTY